MDWKGPTRSRTWLIDKVFDRGLGWDIPAEAAPVTPSLAQDGNPTYTVTVGEINVICWEIREWEDDGVERDVSAGRLAAKVEFTGITIHNPSALLTDGYRWNGLPSCGFNAAGQPTLHTAFPISETFPVDLARRQLMVCIGLLVQQAQTLLTAWRGNAVKPTQPTARQRDWGTAKGVAAVVGAFLGALTGLS